MPRLAFGLMLWFISDIIYYLVCIRPWRFGSFPVGGTIGAPSVDKVESDMCFRLRRYCLESRSRYNFFLSRRVKFVIFYIQCVSLLVFTPLKFYWVIRF